jgi:hypothetical protein
MRGLMAVVAILALASGGCRLRKKGAATKAVIEDDGQLASVVSVAEPRTAPQLTRGFYSVEADSWRWTAKNFSVVLRPPKGSDQKGAVLQMNFSIPEAVFNRLGAITVTAHVNGTDAGPQTFSTAGEGVYRRDVPGAALASDVVSVDFSLDKGLPPTQQDARELGIVVTSIGLTAK